MAAVRMRDEAVGFDSDEEAERSLSKKERAERDKLRRKNQKRKEKKKRAKDRKKEDDVEPDSGTGDLGDTEDDVEIEYVEENLEMPESDPNFFYFSKVFQAFKIAEGSEKEGDKKDTVKTDSGSVTLETKIKDESGGPTKAAILERILQEEEEEKKEKEKEDADNAAPKMSKKKLKLKNRPSIADLKSFCSRPDVVEWHDVTSKYPKLLVHLKSLRNTIPVPRHWCFKRKYLAGKRGFERPPFELPDFIQRTGVMEMRAAFAEKEEEKSLKTKMREKVRPKMGRIDIDYQKLHDAFFRWQTKPKMTVIGDLYYEGKELEAQLREKKPGELTDDLRVALGMPVGPNADKFPPPWLIAMQRYGPPPSYPNLKIPGLNAAIPESCSFGYHAGGWGKPPVDEHGKPLYGDVFGATAPNQPGGPAGVDEIEEKPWGEMDSEESDDDEDEDVEDVGAIEGQTEDDISGLLTPAAAEGLITPSGISSGLPTGVETPDSIELRKRKALEIEGGETPQSLYQVLPEKRVDRVSGQMMGSTHVYELPGSKKDKGGAAAGGGGGDGGIDVSLNPEELAGLQDPSALKGKYEEGMRKQRAEKDDDFSDMVAEHAARQNRKRKQQEDKKSNAPAGSSKKYKDFKF